MRDATPECDRGGTPFLDSIRRRRLQCEALIWLCSNEPDLQYWAMLADYPLSALHHKFKPLLLHFGLSHTVVAHSFTLPAWMPPRP